MTCNTQDLERWAMAPPEAVLTDASFLRDVLRPRRKPAQKAAAARLQVGQRVKHSDGTTYQITPKGWRKLPC